MRRLAWAVVCALVAAVPAVGLGEKPVPPAPALENVALPPPPPVVGGGEGLGLVPPGGFGPPPAPMHPPYKAPKADGPVVELLDEGIDPLFPVLINDGGGEAGTVTREERDVFAGVEAARVTPMQKYASRIPDWKFKIVEKPKNVGEFRYLRFAWKKSGGSGLMLQLHDPAKSWAFRYHAGRNVYGWQPSTLVSATLPNEWELVTRDLFKDYGAFTLTGFALSPLDGTHALFDHMLLGRTIEDLDKATDTALGRGKPAAALAGKEREALWKDLMGADRVKAAAAQRAFLASAAGHVGFIRDQLAGAAPEKELHAKIQRLVADLDADEFDVRDRATDELVKLGAPALDAVQALAASPPNDEVSYRARIILRKVKGGAGEVGSAGRTVRAVRVLERAATADAKSLLTKFAEGEFGFLVAPDAKAALARMAKKP